MFINLGGSYANPGPILHYAPLSLSPILRLFFTTPTSGNFPLASFMPIPELSHAWNIKLVPTTKHIGASIKAAQASQLVGRAFFFLQ